MVRGPRIDPVTRAGQRSDVIDFVGGRMHYSPANDSDQHVANIVHKSNSVFTQCLTRSARQPSRHGLEWLDDYHHDDRDQ